MVLFIDGESILTYVDFDCGITFYPETSRKVKDINRERKAIHDTVKIPSASQVTINLTVFFDGEHTSNVFQDPCILWDMDPAAALSLNHTLDSDLMNFQHPQT